jgi:hypothetical protein
LNQSPSFHFPQAPEAGFENAYGMNKSDGKTGIEPKIFKSLNKSSGFNFQVNSLAQAEKGFSSGPGRRITAFSDRESCLFGRWFF